MLWVQIEAQTIAGPKDGPSSPLSPPPLLISMTIKQLGIKGGQIPNLSIVISSLEVGYHSASVSPVSVDKTIIILLCTVILLLTFYAMQLSRHSPLWVQEVCSPISSDVPLVIWHMRDGFLKKLVNSLILSVILENSLGLASSICLVIFSSLYWYLSNPV